MAVGVTNHPGSTTAARMEQSGQDPSPSPGQQERVLSPLPGAHTLILNQQQEEKLGDEGERDARRLSSPTTLSAAGLGLCTEPPEAFHRTQAARCCPGPNPAPGTLMGTKAMPVLGESFICGVGVFWAPFLVFLAVA